MLNPSLEREPLRPGYGDGVAIRSIYITSPNPGRISLALEDTAHAFRIDFDHSDNRITRLKAKWDRNPMSTCPGASQQLEHLVGTELNGKLGSLTNFSDPRSHCTHMFDAMSLAIVHAYQGRADCRYDVVTPDGENCLVTASLRYNGQEMMAMQLQNYENIVAPVPFGGRTIFKGFLKWADTELDEQQFEYGFLLQKAMFVAQSQMKNIEKNRGLGAEKIGFRENVCYGSQPFHYADAIVVGALRRFKSEPEEQVLQFFTAEARQRPSLLETELTG